MDSTANVCGPEGCTIDFSAPVQKIHVVKDGESLSSIGKTLGLVWQTIAEKNNIVAPYTVKTGDKLKY